MFGLMHDSLFTAFGEQGTVLHKSGKTTSVKVVIARRVDYIDEYGEVARKIDKASFLSSSVDVSTGDELELASGVNSGTWAVGKMVENNSYVQGREIVKK